MRRKDSICQATARQEYDEPELIHINPFAPNLDRTKTFKKIKNKSKGIRVNKDMEVPVQESRRLRPTRAAKVKCLQKLPKVVTDDDSEQEDLSKLLPNQQQGKQNTDESICNADVAVEDYKERKERRRQYYLKHRENESIEKRERRLERQRVYALNRRANETVEEHKQRLERDRLSKLKQKETVEKHDRLSDRQYMFEQSVCESYVQYKQRLEQHREDELKHTGIVIIEQPETGERKVNRGNITGIHSNENIIPASDNEDNIQFFDNTALEIIKDSDANKNDDNMSITVGDIKTEIREPIDAKNEDNPGQVEAGVETDRTQQITCNENNSVDGTKSEEPINNSNPLELHTADDTSEQCDVTGLKQITKPSLTSQNSEAPQDAPNDTQCKKASILQSLLSQPVRAPTVPSLQQLLNTMNKDSNKPKNVQKRKGYVTAEAKERRLERIRQRRADESVEERERRRERQRYYYYASKYNIRESVERRFQRIELLRPFELRYIPEETLEEREQRLEKYRQLKLKRDTSADQLDGLKRRRKLTKYKDTEIVGRCEKIKHFDQHDTVKEAKIEPSNESDNIINIVPESNNDPTLSVNDSVDIINDIETGDEFEVKRVLKMEIHVDFEGVQQITSNQVNPTISVSNTEEEAKDITLKPTKDPLIDDVVNKEVVNENKKLSINVKKEPLGDETVSPEVTNIENSNINPKINCIVAKLPKVETKAHMEVNEVGPGAVKIEKV